MPYLEHTPTQTDSAAVPEHIEETVQAVSRLHASHHEEASLSQRIVEQLTRQIGRPAFIIVLAALIACWITLNSGFVAIAGEPIDPPPFAWLEIAMTLAALFMTIIILTTQRRADKLAGLRDQLTLELSMLAEQKSAKIISLLEELRRDDPNITDRLDRHATALSEPADPDAVLFALKDQQPLQP